MNLVLFGPPGAGKSTYGEKLVEKYNLKRIAPGDIIREHIKNNTDLGRRVKETIEKGNLVSDSLAIALVEQAVLGKRSGFLFDGFPRTVGQAEYLRKEFPIDLVLNLVVPTDVVLERLMLRGRTDDTQDVILNRLKVYKDQSEPVLRFLQDIVKDIDGVGTIEEVWKRIENALPLF